jgi:hypothetical protein
MPTKFHECSKSQIIDGISKKIGEFTEVVPILKDQVDNIRKVLEDNGHLGLKSSVIILSENVKNLNCLLEESKLDRQELHASVEHLVNYRTILETTFSEKDKASSEKAVRRNNIRWLIMALIAFFGLTSAMYFEMRKEQKQNTILKTELKIDNTK